jgi:hypothetical protein
VLAFCIFGLSGIVIFAIIVHAVITFVDHRRRYQYLDAKKFQAGFPLQPPPGSPITAMPQFNTAMSGYTMLGSTVGGVTISPDSTLLYKGINVRSNKHAVVAWLSCYSSRSRLDG